MKRVALVRIVRPPAARRRRGGAFTIVELLSAVAIIALLVAIITPSLSAGRTLARSAICRHQLHQIAQAFHANATNLAKSVGPGGSSVPLYIPATWPGTPMNIVPTKKIYICPEDPLTNADLTLYYIHSNFDGVSFNGPGLDIFFDDNEGCCKLLDETDDYYEYGFDDGRINDLDYGSIDITIRVTKKAPVIGTYMSDSYQGYNSSDGTGVLSLYCGSRVVTGWEDFREVAKGATFLIGGGATNYGMNAKLGGHNVAPDTVVLLDYPCLLANDKEDMDQALAEAAQRHRGKVNTLFADESVAGLWSTHLNPDIGSNADRWSP